MIELGRLCSAYNQPVETGRTRRESVADSQKVTSYNRKKDDEHPNVAGG